MICLEYCFSDLFIVICRKARDLLFSCSWGWIQLLCNCPQCLFQVQCLSKLLKIWIFRSTQIPSLFSYRKSYPLVVKIFLSKLWVQNFFFFFWGKIWCFWVSAYCLYLYLPNSVTREYSMKQDMFLPILKNILLEALFLPFRMLSTQLPSWFAEMAL